MKLESPVKLWDECVSLLLLVGPCANQEFILNNNNALIKVYNKNIVGHTSRNINECDLSPS
jgi:hypothetical protein